MTNNTETELPSSVYEALGWQGGTVHQVIEEIQSLQSRIKELEAIVDIKAPVKKRLEIMNRWELENYIGLLEKQLKFTGEKFKLSRIENERLKIDNEKLQLETGGQAFQDDTMALLCALGLGDHARSESCHKIIVDEIIPKIQLLAQERDICKQLFYDEQAVSRNRLLQFQQLQSQLSRMEGIVEKAKKIILSIGPGNSHNPKYMGAHCEGFIGGCPCFYNEIFEEIEALSSRARTITPKSRGLDCEN